MRTTHTTSSLPRPFAPLRLAMLAALVGTTFGCQQPEVILPASLQAPVAFAVAHGDVCLRLSQISDEGLLGARLDACRTQDESGASIVRERGAIGLVANMNENRLGVVALDRNVPSLVDLDLATPGVTHIPVGRRPIDVGVSPDGTVAYSMNELDQDVSVVNLWAMRALPEPLKLPGIPAALDVQPRTGHVVAGVVGQISGGAVALSSSLQVHPGVRCAAPEVLPVEVGQVPAESGCEGADAPWQSVPLEGILKDVAVDPVTGHAYVIYADLGWMSVVALDEESRAGEACLEGGEAPCEVARIGVTHECSDGLDNDGDGFADQDDIQCFGPLGAESRGGVGTRAMGACADGEDGDGDGLTDRDDPDCRVASQQSEDEVLGFDEQDAVCGDGADNDGDGLIDLLDPDCYGRYGQREDTVATPGLTDLSVDELGIFAYILNPSTNSMLVVDLQNRRLLQPSKVASTTSPFSSSLGVPISRTVAPTAVTGTITRSVARDPRIEYAATHALVDYDLGAYVTGDNGFLYYVDVATIDCDVWEPEALLDEASFYLRPELLAGKLESRCLVVPDELLSDQVDVAASCEEYLLCRDCVRTRGLDAFDACALCDRYEDQMAYERAGQVCGLDERVFEEGLLTRVFNPRFVVRDANVSVDAGQAGSAQCTQPDALLDAINQSIANNPMGSQVGGCGSPLVQQPLSVTIPTRGADAVDDFVTSQRIDVAEQRAVRLLMDESGAVTRQLVVDTEDFVVREQDWTITYEGVLPGTRRSDGILDEDEEGVLDVGSLDPCVSDVRPGDVLVIRSEPGTTTGGVPAGCEAFETPAQFDGQAWREYEVAQVNEDQITFVTKADAQNVVSRLPTSQCFPRGIDYEVRASNAWVVVGSATGIASGKIARDGVCVPGNGADAPRVQSRVRGGERFVGPGVSFWMTQGVVEPVRDANYIISVARSFSAASTPSRLSINAATPAPTEVHFERLYSAVPGENGAWPASPSRKRLILVVEPADNVIIAREPFAEQKNNVIR